MKIHANFWQFQISSVERQLLMGIAHLIIRAVKSNYMQNDRAGLNCFGTSIYFLGTQ